MTNDERDLLLSIAAYTALIIGSYVEPVDKENEATAYLLKAAKLDGAEYGFCYGKCYEHLLHLIKRVSLEWERSR